MSESNWFDESKKKTFPNGLLLNSECERIYQIAKGCETAVDLGTFCGLSAVILSFACKNVFTFDVFDAIEEMNDADSFQYKVLFERTGHRYEKVKKALEKYKNITVTQKETRLAGREWTNGGVDVIFVDADHSTECTLGNVDAWFPHLKIGSKVIFHDNNDIHPEVQAAIKTLEQDSRFSFFDPGYGHYSLAACEVVSK